MPIENFANRITIDVEEDDGGTEMMESSRKSNKGARPRRQGRLSASAKGAPQSRRRPPPKTKSRSLSPEQRRRRSTRAMPNRNQKSRSLSPEQLMRRRRRSKRDQLLRKENSKRDLMLHQDRRSSKRDLMRSEGSKRDLMLNNSDRRSSKRDLMRSEGSKRDLMLNNSDRRSSKRDLMRKEGGEIDNSNRQRRRGRRTALDGSHQGRRSLSSAGSRPKTLPGLGRTVSRSLSVDRKPRRKRGSVLGNASEKGVRTSRRRGSLNDTISMSVSQSQNSSRLEDISCQGAEWTSLKSSTSSEPTAEEATGIHQRYKARERDCLRNRLVQHDNRLSLRVKDEESEEEEEIEEPATKKKSSDWKKAKKALTKMTKKMVEQAEQIMANTSNNRNKTITKTSDKLKSSSEKECARGSMVVVKRSNNTHPMQDKSGFLDDLASFEFTTEGVEELQVVPPLA